MISVRCPKCRREIKGRDQITAAAGLGQHLKTCNGQPGRPVRRHLEQLPPGTSLSAGGIILATRIPK